MRFLTYTSRILQKGCRLVDEFSIAPLTVGKKLISKAISGQNGLYISGNRSILLLYWLVFGLLRLTSMSIKEWDWLPRLMSRVWFAVLRKEGVCNHPSVCSNPSTNPAPPSQIKRNNVMINARLDYSRFSLISNYIGFRLIALDYTVRI